MIALWHKNIFYITSMTKPDIWKREDLTSVNAGSTLGPDIAADPISAGIEAVPPRTKNVFEGYVDVGQGGLYHCKENCYEKYGTKCVGYNCHHIQGTRSMCLCKILV